MNVLALCGSLKARSANLDLLKLAIARAPAAMVITLYDGIRDLPLYNPDLERDGVPASVASWRAAVAASDALLIASPEYGHSLPGPLKNAIDWLIGSGELERKVVAITASSVSAERGVLGLRALATTLGAVSARLVGGAPIARGAAFDEDLARLLLALEAEASRSEVRASS